MLLKSQKDMLLQLKFEKLEPWKVIYMKYDLFNNQLLSFKQLVINFQPVN